jgi:hypothetical protein
VRWNVLFGCEIRDFIRLSLKVLVIEISENKVECGDAGADVFNFVVTAVPKVLPSDLAVQPS